MNCDQAFDLLTDLQRRHSPALGEHLARCARCRGMAEALSPVLGLWDDAVGSGGIGTQMTSVRSATAVHAQNDDRATHSLARSHWTSPRQWLAAFAAGVIVAMGFHAIAGRPFGGAAPLPASSVTQCTWLEREAEKLSAGRSAEAVILSCVACHVRHPAGELVTLPQL